MNLRVRIWVAISLAALASACASTGAVPRPFPTPGRTPAPPATGISGSPLPSVSPIDAYQLVGTALNLRGVRYRNGGADPDGFDCSGFTRYVFAQYGRTLPRDVREQFEAGIEVPPDRLQAGDLVFFSTVAAGASHVGIAIGGDQFIHAPSSNGVVRVERLTAAYWSRRFVGIKRIN